MRLALFFFVLGMLSTSAKSWSQQMGLELNYRNVSIKQILLDIEDKSNYDFVYSNDDFDVARKVSIELRNASIGQVLDILLDKTGMGYRFRDHVVIISPKEDSSPRITGQGTRTVSGKVTDPLGMPLPGVTVAVKGSTTGTITATDGSYSLANVPSDAVLIFSFVGMRAQEIAVDGKSTIHATMEEEIVGIEEVVAVGYGVQKKVNLTGAVSAVNSEDLIKRQVGQSSMLLQGIASGVTVTQRSGQPGKDGGSIRIRGVGTLNTSDPLVLVDGVEMGIDNVDPNLIESISVLKDAASSAIYGSRAANGVILITTKRAKDGLFSISFNNYMGWQKRTNKRRPVNAIDHMTLLDEAYTNIGSRPLYGTDVIENYKLNMASDPDNYPNLNWQDELYTEDGFQNNHFLTVTAGTEKIKVLAGIGYFRQNGLIPNTSYERYTARFNSDMMISPKLSVRFDIFLRAMSTKEPGSGIDEIIYWANRMPATQPNMLTSGLRGIGWDGTNPVAMAESGFQKEKKPSVAASAGINYAITDFLKFEASFSGHYVHKMGSVFNPVINTYYPNGTLAYQKPSVSSLRENRASTLNKDLKLLTRFNKSFGDHTIQGLLGYSAETYDEDNISAFRDTYAFPQYPVLDAGARENQQASGTKKEWILQSVFARLNYDYQSKYLFEANLRYDGSSRFAKNNRWSMFPSFSVGWRISEEAFWDGLKPYVQNLKIRTSYGELGNQLIGEYRFTSYLTYNTYIFGGNATQGAALTDMANSLISWETTKTFDVGLDLTVLNQKLELTADYYTKRTSDILMKLNIPLTTGLNAPDQNAGEVNNKGWEVAATWNDRIADFKYSIGLSLSDVKNEIIDLKGIQNTGLLVNNEGYPVNSIYGYQAIGYITEEDFNEDGTYKGPKQFGALAPGDIKYKNITEDELINADDQTVIGSTIPRYTYGINIGMEYKGFDLSMFWQGVGKADGYLYQQSTMPFHLGGTAMEMHKDRWTPDNRDAAFPRLAFNQTNNEQNSTFWMKDASYLRLKNIQLGYTFPKSILNKTFLKDLRLYVSGQNILTLFDHFWDGYDVEAPVGRGSFYPQVKLYTLGIDVKF